MAETKLVEVTSDSGRVYHLDFDTVFGTGGFGQVFAGEAFPDRHPVAVKMYRRFGDADDRRVREAIRRQLDIRHPRILHALDTGTHQRQQFVVMERAEESLATRMKRERLTEEDAALYFYDAALGVLHLNEQHLVHRDVKPSNLLLGRDNRVRISDFDLIKDLESSDELTKYSTGLGSVHYRSPELIREARDARASADAWGLGVTLYEMLANRLPFTGDVFNGSLLSAIDTGEFKRLGEERSEYAFWDELLDCLLRKDANARPAATDLFTEQYLPFVRYAVDLCWKSNRFEQAYEILSATNWAQTAWLYVDRLLASAALGNTSVPQYEMPVGSARVREVLDAAIAIAKSAPASSPLVPSLRAILLRQLRDPFERPFDNVVLATRQKRGPPSVGPNARAPIKDDVLEWTEYLSVYPNGRQATEVRDRLGSGEAEIAKIEEVYNRLMFLNENSLLALKSVAGHLDVFDATTAKVESKPFKMDGSVTNWRRSPNGSQAVFFSDTAFRIFDGTDVKLVRQNQKKIRSITWLSEDRAIVVAQDGLFLWTRGNWDNLVIDKRALTSIQQAWSLSGDRLAVQNTDSHIHLVSYSLSGMTLTAWEVSDGFIESTPPIAILPGRELLVNQRGLFPLDGGKPRLFAKEFNAAVAFSVSADEKVLAAVQAREISVAMMNEHESIDEPMPQWRPLHIKPDPEYSFHAVALSENGSLLAIAQKMDKHAEIGSMAIITTGLF